MGTEEVTFDDKTFLLTRERASSLKEKPIAVVPASSSTPGGFELQPPPSPAPIEAPAAGSIRLCLRGTIPPEQWNKLGTKLLPKLRVAGKDLSLGLDASLTLRAEDVRHVEADLRQALRDLGLERLVRIEKKE